MAATTPLDDVLGVVHVTVVEGKRLPAKDLNHSSDPFVVLHYGDVSQRTTVKKKTLAPFWQESFQFLCTVNTRAYVLKFDCWDWDRATSNDFIGSAEIPTETLWTTTTTAAQEREVEVPLHDKQGHSAGALIVRMRTRSRDDIERTFWLAAAKYFDSDGSGAIDRLELAGLVSALEGSLTDTEIDALFQDVDKDDDGKLSYNELLDWARRPGNTGRLTGREDLVWKLSVFMPDDGDSAATSAAAVLQDAERYLGAPLVASGQHTAQTFSGMSILVRERKSGKVVEEKISSSIKTAMRIMYSNPGGRVSVGTGNVKKLLRHLTENQGRAYNDPKSKTQIPKFVVFHHLDMNESLLTVEEFNTFNEFFYRKLKPGSRVIEHAADPSVAVSPADCRLSAFQTLDDATRIWIKGTTFSLQSLLCDDALAAEFRNCSVIIARLAPQDYHRYHSPVAGVVGEMTPIDGTFYTVNPIAVREKVDVYGENKRVVTSIMSPVFGKVVFIAVGATCVGSIAWTAETGQQVEKGGELGYFAFGGSTVILLFKQGAITLDSDLLANSAKPIETLVRMGYSIGKHTQ